MSISHGGDIYTTMEKLGRPVLDFSANNNLFGIPEGVLAAATQALQDCRNYPDPLCRELVQSISAFERVRPQWVHCGNGAADVLYRLVLARRPKKALVLAPTFSEYQRALELVGCQVEQFPLKEEEDFRLEEGILTAIVPGVEMVCICNPNNPTGALVRPALMEQILARCGECGALLLVDECFNDFLENPIWHTLTPFLEANSHLFILKAFTKFYAMAGLRLGYGLSSDEGLLERMAGCGQPWSVSIPAQAAGVAALKESEYQARTRRELPLQRQALADGLTALGCKVYRPRANYIFFRLPGVYDLKERLEGEGILIRSCGNYQNLGEDYYRVAVRVEEENRQLLEALTAILGERA